MIVDMSFDMWAGIYIKPHPCTCNVYETLGQSKAAATFRHEQELYISSRGYGRTIK